MIDVVIIDDHELVRSGIESILSAIENISVVSVADCCEQAISAVESHAPHVVVMDICMPGIGGFEACRRLLQCYPEVKIIALSVKKDGHVPQQFLKLGVQGFVSKKVSAAELVEAIQQVADGKYYLCSEVAKNMALSVLQGNQGSPFDRLSLREVEVVGLVLQGKSINEMSQELMLSDKTINTYRYRVYEKLQIKNDVELTRLAVKFNYIDISLI